MKDKNTLLETITDAIHTKTIVFRLNDKDYIANKKWSIERIEDVMNRLGCNIFEISINGRIIKYEKQN